MCHLSPTVHLAWAVLSCALQIFLIVHLWRYDRFKCLLWSSGRQPGTFKRIMTYSYLTSVPALVIFSVAMAVLKYRNGYTFIPEVGGVVPTPFQLWPMADQDWLQPLYIIFGVVWGLEIVTHLEELTFWLFLLRQGPQQRKWFSSIEFRTWAFGSCIAIIGLPATAIVTRINPLKAEAWIFLVGSSASLVVTLLFFTVLFKFPAFLRRVEKEGAATAVILRLVKFHELNIMRVIFRLFMAIPLIILGVDGVLGHQIINESALWTDMLAFFSAVGTVVSSSMTLLIFFPRSLAEDSNWRPQTYELASTHGSFISTPSGFPDHSVRHSACSLSDTTLVQQRHLRVKTGPINPFEDRDTPVSQSTPMTIPLKAETQRSSNFRYQNPSTTPYYSSNGVYVDDTGDSDSSYAPPVENAEKSRLQSWRPGADLERGLETLDRIDSPVLGVEPHADSRANKNPEKLKVRMMELSEVIHVGLNKPERPLRLHPYITTFTSPIDLRDSGDDSIPRAL